MVEPGNRSGGSCGRGAGTTLEGETGVALAGKGVLAIWNGIAPEAEADFVAWHIREHIPERVAVPGFLRGRRYVAERGHPRYFNFYEVESPQTLVSPAYVARLNAPSEWTRQVVRHFTDTSRTICTVAQSLGLGEGAFVATLRLSAAEGRERFLAGIGPVLPALMDEPGIVAVHLLEGQGGGSNGQTAEKALRKQPDTTVDWVLLVEAADRAPLEAAMTSRLAPETLAGFSAGLDAERDCGIYRLQYGLAQHELA